MDLNIPADWRAILAVVHSISPGAIIGGGALRDLDNGKPVKDLDIFIDPETDAESLFDVFDEQGYYKTQDLSADYVDGDMFEVERIVELQAFGKTTLNLIAVLPGKTPVEDAERYDWGLCQIYFDGTDVVATDAYLRDKAERTLTLCRCNSAKGFKRSLKRAERLSAKYPEHLIQIPDHFVQYGVQ